MVAFAAAADNLRLGLSVVADSVNPLEITRAAWRSVAVAAGVPFVEIEVICSDAVEHRRRVETRAADIVGFALPTWDDVVGREYEAWGSARVVIDTAGLSEQQGAEVLERALAVG